MTYSPAVQGKCLGCSTCTLPTLAVSSLAFSNTKITPCELEAAASSSSSAGGATRPPTIIAKLCRKTVLPVIASGGVGRNLGRQDVDALLGNNPKQKKLGTGDVQGKNVVITQKH